LKKTKYSEEIIGHDWKCDICHKDINSESDIAHHFKTDCIDEVCHDCIKNFPTLILQDSMLVNNEIIDIICDCLFSEVTRSAKRTPVNLNHGIFSLWCDEGYRFMKKHESREELEKFISFEKDEDDSLLEVLEDGKPLRAKIISVITYDNKEMGW